MTFAFTVPAWLILTFGWIVAAALALYVVVLLCRLSWEGWKFAFRVYPGAWKGIAAFYRWWHFEGGKKMYPEYQELRERLTKATIERDRLSRLVAYLGPGEEKEAEARMKRGWTGE